MRLFCWIRFSPDILFLQEKLPVIKCCYGSYPNHSSQYSVCNYFFCSVALFLSSTVFVFQRGNPILKHIRNVPWEFATIIPDYIMGRTNCALFLRLVFFLSYVLITCTMKLPSGSLKPIEKLESLNIYQSKNKKMTTRPFWKKHC